MKRSKVMMIYRLEGVYGMDYSFNVFLLVYFNI